MTCMNANPFGVSYLEAIAEETPILSKVNTCMAKTASYSRTRN